MSRKELAKQAWKAMKDEYFRIHPKAGLTWWDLPLEEQPLEFKGHMYDILWSLMEGRRID